MNHQTTKKRQSAFTILQLKFFMICFIFVQVFILIFHIKFTDLQENSASQGILGWSSPCILRAKEWQQKCGSRFGKPKPESNNKECTEQAKVLWRCLGGSVEDFMLERNRTNDNDDDDTSEHQEDSGAPALKDQEEDDDTEPSIDCDIEDNETFDTKSEDIESEKRSTEEIHGLGGLECSGHGGPDTHTDAVEELVYWRDTPVDATRKSPFFEDAQKKYLTFQPDNAGFNNARMGFESILVLAHATGRTLVMPPHSEFEHLRRGASFDYNDVFHLDFLVAEHSGLDIISMEEFLEREGTTGLLLDQSSGTSLKPPQNQSNWKHRKHLDCLWDYLSKVGYVPEWNPNRCVAAIPASSGIAHVRALESMMNDIMNSTLAPLPKPADFVNNPTPVDAPPIERLRELLGKRTEICIYNEEMQKAPLLHYSHKLLAQFYQFVFFEDWRQDVWSKRFVRDHVRYSDEIACAAARVVAKLREKARNNRKMGDNIHGIFDSMHVRRGDFLKVYHNTADLDATELYKYSSDELSEGSTLFIATDERKKSFFDPLKKHYEVFFLDDFRSELIGLNSHFFGMVDQLVASRGRIFFGTFHSTLTNYITRMRGYYATKNKLNGHKAGTTRSFYFYPPEVKMTLQSYYPVSKPLWIREFPAGWRDIDRGI